jgi:hypothetical protein
MRLIKPYIKSKIFCPIFGVSSVQQICDISIDMQDKTGELDMEIVLIIFIIAVCYDLQNT